MNSFVAMCEAIGSWHVSTFDTSYRFVVHSGQSVIMKLHFDLEPISLGNIILAQSPVLSVPQ